MRSNITSMEVEDWEFSSGETSDSEICVQDTNDEEPYYTSGDIPKMQFRKNISMARWDKDMGMAEVIENKGGMWITTGVVRQGKIYCSIEETLFLAERGELHLLDADDSSVQLENIYEKVAEGKFGCCWESFEVYRHLKSLGYIVSRHSIPWTVKTVKNNHTSAECIPEIMVRTDEKCGDPNLINGSTLPPLNVPVTAKWHYLSAFVYFVVVNAAACAYGAISLVVALGRRGGGNRRGIMAVAIALLDVVMVALLFSGNGAAAAIGVMGYKGNSHVRWEKVCNAFGKFCHQVAAGIVLSLLGSVAFLLLPVISALEKKT